MKAIDTNVLVRLITRDDEEQAAIADAIVATPVFLPLTVLVELAWVLGSGRFRYNRARLSATLLALIEVQTLSVPHHDEVRQAIERFARGADIADMLHLVAARGATAFVTFDRDFAAACGDGTPIPIELVA